MENHFKYINVEEWRKDKPQYGVAITLWLSDGHKLNIVSCIKLHEMETKFWSSLQLRLFSYQERFASSISATYNRSKHLNEIFDTLLLCIKHRDGKLMLQLRVKYAITMYTGLLMTQESLQLWTSTTTKYSNRQHFTGLWRAISSSAKRRGPWECHQWGRLAFNSIVFLQTPWASYEWNRASLSKYFIGFFGRTSNSAT